MGLRTITCPPRYEPEDCPFGSNSPVCSRHSPVDCLPKSTYPSHLILFPSSPTSGDASISGPIVSCEEVVVRFANHSSLLPPPPPLFVKSYLWRRIDAVGFRLNDRLWGRQAFGRVLG
ncbi:hypothetical protein JAAARDRAFT_646181 [Jaapia argillacea MUCL 33604]|uniref:Uncharacterized protein n=1 Tax=Jaapia argillacea MUCL 33604 TaxID=933084 RepID=A0A067PYA3_9AGAM|nr:hypothetical protein JAAARDRAFT_646181 [Jaapia argillacea MUCL 33604]